MRELSRRRRACCRPDWSRLPEHPLFLVLLKLNFVDFCSFSCVCKAWRSVAKDSEKIHAASQPPLLLRLVGPPCNALYCFRERRYLCTRTRRTGQVDGPRRLHYLCVVRGFSCGYLIVSDPFAGDRTFLARPLTGAIVGGVEFPVCPPSYPLVTMVLTAPPTSPACVLAAVQQDSSSCSIHVFCSRPGDSLWSIHRIPVPHLGRRRLSPFSTNVAVLDGRIHLMVKNELLVIELVPDLSVTWLQMEGSTFPPETQYYDYLVECGGELLAIVGRNMESLRVHRFDPSTRRWLPADDLRGHAIAADEFAPWLSWKPSAWAGEAGDCVYFMGKKAVRVFRLVQGRLGLVCDRRSGIDIRKFFRWVIPGLLL